MVNRKFFVVYFNSGMINFFFIKSLDVKNSLYPVSVLSVFFNLQIFFNASTFIPAGINP